MSGAKLVVESASQGDHVNAAVGTVKQATSASEMVYLTLEVCLNMINTHKQLWVKEQMRYSNCFALLHDQHSLPLPLVI